MSTARGRTPSAAPRLLVLLLAAALVACGEEAIPARPETPAAPAAPATDLLNPYVLEVARSYPTDGTHGYHWPRRGSWLGFTQDVTYEGELLGAGDPQGRCHCSGLTLEVFLRAWARRSRERGEPARIRGLDLEGLRAFQRAWFGTGGDRATLYTALTTRGLGTRIEDWEDARPGDFVQLWRHSGSGHSCIFLEWVREEGRIVGLRYWSTQSSTGGIGEREERFGGSGSAVKADELYIVRVGPGVDGG